MKALLLLLLSMSNIDAWRICPTEPSRINWSVTSNIQDHKFRTLFCDGVELFKPDGEVYPDGVCLDGNTIVKRQTACGNYEIKVGMRISGVETITRFCWRVIPESTLNYEVKIERAGQ